MAKLHRIEMTVFRLVVDRKRLAPGICSKFGGGGGCGITALSPRLLCSIYGKERKKERKGSVFI